MVRILVFSGSVRSGSLNGKLAAAAALELGTLGADVTLISLVDYPMPLYDGDMEAASGVPAAAVALAGQFVSHHGIFIAGPEYNAGITPLTKNTIDWVSRVKAPANAFKGRVFALGSASPGGYGGFRSQMATRQVLELGLGALVIPESVAVGAAHEAFDEGGRLVNERARAMLSATCRSLMEKAEALRG